MASNDQANPIPLNEQYSAHNPKGIKPEQPLSAQQLMAMRQRQDEIIGRIKTDVELRKWSVDQACGLAGSENPLPKDTFRDPVRLAREIHAFLTEGTSEKV